jgi:hypothetical protein
MAMNQLFHEFPSLSFEGSLVEDTLMEVEENENSLDN